MMLSSARSRITALSARSSRLASRAGYSVSAPRWSENPVAVNDPTPKKPTSSISPSNAIPSDPMDAWSKPLQEDPEVGERLRQLQAPNRATTWAKSQQPRELAMTGPRFEQTIMEYQVSIFFASVYSNCLRREGVGGRKETCWRSILAIQQDIRRFLDQLNTANIVGIAPTIRCDRVDPQTTRAVAEGASCCL